MTFLLELSIDNIIEISELVNEVIYFGFIFILLELALHQAIKELSYAVAYFLWAPFISLVISE